LSARLLLALAGLLLLGAAPPPAGRCEALKGAAIPGVEIVTAERLAGAFAAPDGSRLALPPLCRVRGIARPEPASLITFELWLPEGWNGRYYQLGNGGFAGNIHFPSLAAEAARGNAAAITDTGHSGTGQFDASWARGHPERVTDYGHRSIKATSDAAAVLVRAFYGRPADKRYFAGCSNGGRQALTAAQRYPDDWDGIIAGAPAVYFSRQLAAFADIQHALRVDPLGFIPPAKLPIIQAAALASCPAGTVDGGVALDPRRCRFRPRRLLCPREDRPDCLTVPQLDSLRAIMVAGYQPTSAAGPDGWASWIVNPDPAAPSQLAFALQGFRYLLQDRPDWRLSEHRPYSGVPVPWSYSEIDGGALDYFRFRDRGGKIIAYFGWADPLLSPAMMLDHYRGVRGMMGRKGRSRFFRLFMVPGMAHCQGGAGFTSFGQSIPAPAAVADPRHDIRLALEAWVERGEAPDALVAARWREGDPARGLEATRTLHPWH
jgi:feruloyl esterase